MCWLVGFCMLLSMLLLVFAVASLQPFTITHCFKTLGSDRFDGLLVWWVFVSVSADICAGSLVPGYWVLGIFANRS